MIQAIQKYGLMKGGLRGAKRLGRCKIPNGGVDLP
jgi:putative component of membrane protein insertase Oxa1/YidC/SpoIIIJ protein YidD